MSKTIDELIDQYRLNAIGMDNISDPRKSNKCHDKWHACYKILRETEEGRQAIIRLLQDTEPSVRCGAAAHSLQWVQDNARQVLEALRDSKGPCSFEAEMILNEFEKGRLTFDY